VLVTRSLKRGIEEFYSRVLAPRQSRRAAAALVVMADDQAQRQRVGDEPRNDGFFAERDGYRPDAEDLLEGILLHAANTYEERKVPFLGHLYDGVAHDPTVDPADAHRLLTLAGRLTYRQLGLLSLFAQADEDETARRLMRAAGLRDEGRAVPSPGLLAEIDDLGAEGLIGVRIRGGTPQRISAGLDSNGLATGQPFGALRLLPSGQTLFGAMRLDRLPGGDRDALLEDLSAPDPGDGVA